MHLTCFVRYLRIIRGKLSIIHLTELISLISLGFFPDGQVIPLVELSAKQVAFHIPFEVVEKVYPPVPEQLQLRIAYWSFPENEEDIR